MTDNSPQLDEWRALYEAALRIKEIAPWKWMTEDQVFGVQSPQTSELGFVSVMGMLGEHYAIAVYLGPKELYDFLDMVRSGPSARPERVLEIAQLQASFEDRGMLQDEDRAVIKQLGLKFRGANAWPLFRDYRQGFFPWFLNADQVRFLTHVLEQTLDVTQRLKQDSSLLDAPNNVSYLVRVPCQQEGGLVWEDQVMEVMPPEPVPISLVMDMDALKKLKRLTKRQAAIELDFFMLPSPIQENKGQRPVFPYNLLLVDAHSGMVLGHEMMLPTPSLEAMWGQIPATAVRQLARLGFVPQEVRVRPGMMAQLLEPVAKEVGFRLRQSPVLPNLDQAKESLFQFLGR